MKNGYEILKEVKGSINSEILAYGLGASLLLGGGSLFINEVSANYERLKEERQIELKNKIKSQKIITQISTNNNNNNNYQIAQISIDNDEIGLTPLSLDFRMPPNDKSFFSSNYSLDFLLKSSNAKLRKGAKYFKSQNCGYKTDCLEKLVELSIKNKYNAELVFALIGGETKYDCNQFSPAGAAGCFQFMPKTARDNGLKVPRYRTKNPRRDERFDLHKSMIAWFKFMNKNRNHPKVNSEKRIIAVHNGGYKALNKSKSCRGKLWYECWKNKGYAETRMLVRNTNFFMKEIQRDKRRLGFKQKIKTKFS